MIMDNAWFWINFLPKLKNIVNHYEYKDYIMTHVNNNVFHLEMKWRNKENRTQFCTFSVTFSHPYTIVSILLKGWNLRGIFWQETQKNQLEIVHLFAWWWLSVIFLTSPLHNASFQQPYSGHKIKMWLYLEIPHINR